MSKDIEVQTPDSESGWSIETQVQDSTEIAAQTEDSGMEYEETQMLVVKEIAVQTEDSETEYEETQVLDSKDIAVQTEDSGMEYEETQVLVHTSGTQTKHYTNNANGITKKAGKKNLKKYPCKFCSKSFNQLRYFWRHLENLHNICRIPNEKVSTCACNICGNSFANKSNLRKHTKKIHQLELPTGRSFKCSECQSTFQDISYYFDHIIKAHNISVNMEILQFENEADFESWKLYVEENTISCFRKSYRTLNSTAKYVCHRSGFFVSKNNGKRRLKKGSVKINSYCPASIYVRPTSAGKRFPAEVKFISTHLGHTCDSRMKTKERKKRSSGLTWFEPTGLIQGLNHVVFL